jgi:hypothetical protein
MRIYKYLQQGTSRIRALNLTNLELRKIMLLLLLMMISIFWDITPCSSMKANRRFGEHTDPIVGVEE